MSRTFRAGLIVLGVLSVLDLLTPLATDGEHPPMAVALVAAALGLASLAMVISAWRGAVRAAAVLIGLRLLSALTAVPAFFTAGVPGFAIGAAGAVVALTLAGVLLVMAGMRRVNPVSAS